MDLVRLSVGETEQAPEPKTVMMPRRSGPVILRRSNIVSGSIIRIRSIVDCVCGDVSGTPAEAAIALVVGFINSIMIGGV